MERFTVVVSLGIPILVQNEMLDEEKPYRIVGPDEIDPARGCISIDSPLARALLKRGVGDSATVALPAGETVFEIVAVEYALSAG